MAARQLPSWIDAYFEYSGSRDSPESFRLWAGITAVAAALEMKTWARTGKGKVFPNLYTFLVGPPAVGKTVLTRDIGLLYSKLPTHHIAPTSVTGASLIDSLAESARTVTLRDEQGALVNYQFNALFAVINELKVFLAAYDNGFTAMLTSLWDCDRIHDKKRTGKLDIKIENPCLNLFAATNPADLATILPENAWDQGFMSRVIVVFDSTRNNNDIFHEVDENLPFRAKMVEDLKLIGKMSGKMEFTANAIAMIRKWVHGGQEPAPSHPKLTYYLSRRLHILLKLCIVAAADWGSMEITEQTVGRALTWLLSAESTMPDLFRWMASSGDFSIIEDAIHHMRTIFMKTKQPVPEKLLHMFLNQRVQGAHRIAHIVKAMEMAQWLKIQKAGDAKFYIPSSRARETSA